MCAFFEKSLRLGQELLKSATFLGALLFSVSLTGQLCRAQDLSLAPLAPSNNQTDWMLGPAEADLGTLATISVPTGYRFVDAKGAAAFLQHLGNPVPKGLMGILAPNSGKWFAVFQFEPVGYVSGANASSEVDVTAALKGLQKQVASQNQFRSRVGLSAISQVGWELQPVFNDGRHSLEWAIRANSGSKIVINHTIRLLGRRGTLDATVVQPEGMAAGDAPPLNELMKGVSFKNGQRYADYQTGDKVANENLTQLIAGDESTGEDTVTTEQATLWIGLVCVACVVLAGAGFWAIRRNRARASGRRERAEEPVYRRAAHAHVPAEHAGMMSTKAALSNGANGHHTSRRRRVFNYHKFYSDMILQVSSGASSVPLVLNGKGPARESAERSAREPASNQALVRANMELIANQTTLIEEQRRLLQEQRKLIEEKTRLIQEKSQLLDKQAELFERDLL